MNQSKTSSSDIILEEFRIDTIYCIIQYDLTVHYSDFCHSFWKSFLVFLKIHPSLWNWIFIILKKYNIFERARVSVLFLTENTDESKSRLWIPVGFGLYYKIHLFAFSLYPVDLPFPPFMPKLNGQLFLGQLDEIWISITRQWKTNRRNIKEGKRDWNLEARGAFKKWR